MLRVPFEKLDGEMLGLGPDPPAFQQSGDIVNADGVAPPPRGRERCISAPSGDIQHPPAGLQVGRLTELLGLIENPGGDDGKVAAGPGRLLPLLHGGVIGALTESG